MDYMNAGLFHATHVKRMGVDELHDDDAKHILVGNVVRHKNFR